MTHAAPLPGLDVGVFTHEAIYTPGAYLDFQSRVRELIAAGDRGGALMLWNSVVEVLHHPARQGWALHGERELPLLRVAPCVGYSRARCHNQRGGFRFPWIGVWTRRSVLAQPGAHPVRASVAYHGDPERFTLAEVQAVGTSLTADDLVPPYVHPLSLLSPALARALGGSTRERTCLSPSVRSLRLGGPLSQPRRVKALQLQGVAPG